MRFRLRQMEVFRAVMHSGSMSAAARMLNISQPAVSRLIAYTEQSLGFRLFERDGPRLTPTVEAELLIAEVDRLHETAREVDELARKLASDPGGTLALATSPSLAVRFIPTVIGCFLRAHPQVQVRYQTTLLSDMARELISRQAHVGISVLPLADPAVICEPFLEGRMRCLLPAEHPLAEHEALSLAALAAHPMVMYDRRIPFGRMIGEAFARAGAEPRVAIEVPRAELAISMVSEGVGPAIIDEFALTSGAPPGTVARPLVEEIGVTLSLLRTRHGPPPPRAAHVFVDLMRREALALRGEPRKGAVRTSPSNGR